MADYSVTIHTQEQAEKVAARRNKKNAKRWPLLALAGALETVTAEQILDADRRFLKKMAEDNARMQQRADEFRAQVAAIIAPETLTQLDEQRKRYPTSPEYAANFWRCELRKLECEH